ncbi:HvfB family MNIO-type RiPP peptide maturase [Thiosocius teredinicola]|uniref:HvfB family MNIO-type RiPP peptide maturase n=1 Tax=Thiosocius teredinicola TaxID=1973002 RepID=UPI0009914EFD
MSKHKNTHARYPVTGAGLGLRFELIEQFRTDPPKQVDFLEVAPENWIRVGGSRGKALRELTEQYPLVCHGLSLSIGGPAPLDDGFLHDLKHFLDVNQARVYTEHLSYCGDSGQLYDLMPIPFSEEAVHYVAARIRHVQDVLERRIGMENVSTYAVPTGEMTELDFLTAVLEEADCGLHLDINNIFVNSVNHGFDPYAYLAGIPAERIMYAHIAGHYQEADNLRVDTHGEDVLPEVWDMLDTAYERYGVFPTLLERDFNIPPLDELLGEVDQIVSRQQRWQESADVDVA